MSAPKIAAMARALTVAALLLASACSDDDDPGISPAPGDASTPQADASAGLPSGDAAAADAGTGPSSTAIPLIDWVDGLVDQHTTETSAPDTVHDKNIVDDEEPGKFEKYFQNRP